MNGAAMQALTPLFVPGDRPERFVGAAASGADAVILDLEDAVAPDRKDMARGAVASLADSLPVPVILRVNGAQTPHHADDLALARRIRPAAVMLPKADAAAAGAAAAALEGICLIALVETAQGLAGVRGLAAAPGVGRLAFGSIDFAADLGCADDPAVLAPARFELVLASRLARLPGPLDGVTAKLDGGTELPAAEDARLARNAGLGGKMCIHPRQVAAVRAAFLPDADEIAWAEAVLAAGGGGARLVAGQMVDAPVRLRAEAILRRRG